MRAPLPIAIDNRLTEGDEPYNGAVAEIKVANPFERGRFVHATISLRDDPLACMYVMGGIEQWQFITGRKLQEDFEIVEAGRLQAFDPTAIHISCKAIARFAKDAVYERLKAVLDRTGARDPKTGLRGFDVLRSVLSHGKTLTMVAREAAISRKVATRIFKSALSEAGEVLGLKGRAQARVNDWRCKQ
jgi:hypothetical protein